MLKSGQKFVRYRQKADIREQNLVFAANINHEIESHSTAVQKYTLSLFEKDRSHAYVNQAISAIQFYFRYVLQQTHLIALTFVPKKGKQTASGFGLKAIHRTRKANRLAISGAANRTSSRRTIRTESI